MNLGALGTLGTLGTPNGMKVFELLQPEEGMSLRYCDRYDVMLHKERNL